MSGHVYVFCTGKADGDASQKDLFGGKGAGLAEMTRSASPCRRVHDHAPRCAVGFLARRGCLDAALRGRGRGDGARRGRGDDGAQAWRSPRSRSSCRCARARARRCPA